MIEGGDTKRSRRCHPGIIRAFTRNPQSDQSRASPHQGGAFADVMNATLRLCVLRPPLRLANLRLAQAFADVCECTTGDAAQPACCVLGLALFIDPASLEFRKPSAEFGQLGRREPQDRFFDIFDCHGRRNSTPALELEEQWPANRDVITVFRQPVIDVGKLGPLPPAETDCVAGVRGFELRNPCASHVFEMP
jgi:hypothetical protein